MKDMPTRREFIGGIATLVGVFTFWKTVATPNTYQPAGLVRAGDVVARNVDYVTLNGKRLKGVFEANDVEGWLRRYTSPLTIDYSADGSVRYEYLEGEVRFVWLKRLS
jgi:hypothetical protein